MDPEESTEHLEPEINEPPVQPEEEITAVPVSAIVPQDQDPLFLELQREKKRRPKQKQHLTENKNLARVEPISVQPIATSDTAEEGEPEISEPVVLPSLPVSKKDPILRVAKFLGGKKKKNV